MPPWDSRQYLLFERERMLPCLDLIRRIELDAPERVVDLGSGPGNSTAALKGRWPNARLTGVDSSEEMLDVARAADPTVEWVRDDIGRWDPRTEFDLVFSNAAFQWLPDHRELVPRLWRRVAPGGVLAFQVPAPGGERARWLGAIRKALDRPDWRGLLPNDPSRETVLTPAEYYELLRAGSRRLDLWDTEYCHILPGPLSVVEWTKGTALRPVLERLSTEEERVRFSSRYTTEIEREYPRQADGRVLFPFLRRFVLAYRA